WCSEHQPDRSPAMTEPMQRPDHEASRWPRDFDIRQRYAEQQELLEPPPAQPREEPTADA
ncbi:TPA: hypothetical protein ACGRV5_005432, partial [Pseudomonas aeruginosa]